MILTLIITGKTTPSIQYMAEELHKIICVNQHVFNLTSVVLSNESDHCIILIYYAEKLLKEKSSLGYHTYWIYDASNGKYLAV